MFARYIPFGIALLLSLNLFGEMLPAKSLSKTNNPILVSTEMIRSDKIVLKYSIPNPTFSTISVQRLNGQNTSRAIISNCPHLQNPGEPEIPRIPIRLILPYGKTVDRIEVEPIKKERYSLASSLSYGELEQPISSNERVLPVPDSRIYNSEKQYPDKLHGLIDIQKAFGISIAKVDIYPLIYFAKLGKIEYYEEISVRVHLRSGTIKDDLRIDVERFRKRGKLSEENEDALNTYPSKVSRQETYDYILITSEQIVNNSSVSPNISDLISLRESQGFKCKVVTTEEIEQNYSGAKSNEKVRNFIKFAYNNWNTEFVTLGGDINVVPHFPSRVKYGYNFYDVDSDIPFQCLDGDQWDEDYEAEVYVGRMSVEDANEFSNQLYKIIQYEKEPSTSPMLRTSLGLGCKLDWNNSGMKAIEYLLKEVYPSSWQHDSLYDAIDPTGEWEQEKLITKLASNKYGNVDHDGHGSVGGTMRFSVGETDRFTNTMYPFLYTLSCQTGDFSEDCIAEHFTAENRVGGFFGGILNSEVGLYSQANSTQGSSPSIQRSFYQGFWEQDMEYFSQCNAYSHQMNSDKKFTCFTTNYFGDAATRFRGKDWQITSTKQQIKEYNNETVRSISRILLHSHNLSFNVHVKSKITVNIYSLNGKLIYSVPQKLYNIGKQSIILENNKFSNGIYVVKIKSEFNSFSTKIKL